MHGPFRVIQWATGNIGERALREVIRHAPSISAGSGPGMTRTERAIWRDV